MLNHYVITSNNECFFLSEKYLQEGIDCINTVINNEVDISDIIKSNTAIVGYRCIPSIKIINKQPYVIYTRNIIASSKVREDTALYEIAKDFKEDHLSEIMKVLEI